jgi:hypothetical protein
MQIKNIQIFSSITAADGSWVDVSNLVNLSVMITNTEANTWIEVSDDPNAPIDGAAIGPPSTAPVLSQFPSVPGQQGSFPQSPTPPGDVSMLPAQTFYVKTTFVTKWGETTASAESSLAVTAGNYLLVAAPVPTLAQQPYVTGWNVYVGLATGAEVLQTTPQYQPMRLVDGIGTPGGTVNPLGPGQSTHFAISGALPLLTNIIGGVVKVQGQNFSMVNGYQQTQWVPPASDQSGSAAVGVNVSGNLPASPANNSQTQIVVSGTNVMFNPSGIVWKWLRVRKDATTQVLQTTAFLMGQNG